MSLRTNRRSAFTLIELLVVIAIIALLMACCCPPSRKSARLQTRCSVRFQPPADLRLLHTTSTTTTANCLQASSAVPGRLWRYPGSLEFAATDWCSVLPASLHGTGQCCTRTSSCQPLHCNAPTGSRSAVVRQSAGSIWLNESCYHHPTMPGQLPRSSHSSAPQLHNFPPCTTAVCSRNFRWPGDWYR